MSWNAMRPGRKDDRNKVKRALKLARKSSVKRKFYMDDVPVDPAQSVVQTRSKTSNGWMSRSWVKAMRKMRCHYCGATGGTIDHVVPRCEGGENTPENCVPACFACNGFRGNRPYAWFKKVGWKERIFAGS